MPPSIQQQSNNNNTDDGAAAAASDELMMSPNTNFANRHSDDISTSHATASHSHANKDDIIMSGNYEEDNDDEEEQYETAFSKLAASGRGILGKPSQCTNNGVQQQRATKAAAGSGRRARRGGGYGTAAQTKPSVLESPLPPSSKNIKDGSPADSNRSSKNNDNSTTPLKNDKVDIDGFDVDDFFEGQSPPQAKSSNIMFNDDFALDDFSVGGEDAAEGNKSNIFMETQEGDDGSESGSDSDATRPYDSDGEGSAAKKWRGGDASGGGDSSSSESDSDDGSDLEEDAVVERPRGRTKQTKKKIQEGSNDTNEDASAGGEESEDDGGGFPQSEASGYGFSQGQSQALREMKIAAAANDDGEEKGEEEGKSEGEEDGSGEQEDSQDGSRLGSEEPAGDTPMMESAPTDKAVVAASPTSTPSTDLEAAVAAQVDDQPQVPTNPTDMQILSVVDSLFSRADKESTTAGDINRSVASHFGWSKGQIKEKKGMIKNRLKHLISGNAEPLIEGGTDDDEAKKSKKSRKDKKKGDKKASKATKKKKVAQPDEPQGDDMDEEDPFEGDYESEPEDANNDSSSDYEEPTKTKKKGPGKKKKSKKSADSDSESDASSYSSEDDEEDTKKSKKKRSTKKKRSSRQSGKKGKGKMAQHLRDRHNKARMRQLEEARIRKEELGHLADDEVDDKKQARQEHEGSSSPPKGPQLSEEDRKRAQAIAERFDTNREELRVKRHEERVGLIDRLRMKRLESMEIVDMTVTTTTAVVEVKKSEVVKMEGVVKQEEDGDGKELLPRLTSKSSGDMMLELDDDSSGSGEEDDDSDDDNLEIMAPSSSSAKGNDATAKSGKVNSKKTTSAVDLLFNPKNKSAIAGAQKTSQRRPPAMASNPRMALRNALRARTVQAGNRWLAKELNWKNEAEHIQHCKEKEDQKRRKILQSEKEAALRSQKEEEAIETMMNDDGPQLSEREFNEEEDEEMAMAIEMGQLDENGDAKLDDMQEQGAEEESQPAEAGNLEDKAASDDNNTDSNADAPITTGDDTTKLEENVSESPARMSPGSVVTPLRGQTEAETTSNNNEDAQGGGSEVLADHEASSDPFANDEDVAANDGLEEKADAMKQDLDQTVPLDIKKTGVEVSKDKEPPVREGVAESNMSEEATSLTKEEDNVEEPAEEEPRSKKPKNSAWQAMLRKEKETLAKQKKLQRKGGNTLVDGEAEEEEDEEQGIAGLEDFGFAVHKKDGEDEDDANADNLDEDDLDHVVDEVSDGEGDEDAGDLARQRLQRAEEKERHKEIMRRMREGYDGRRGGIVATGAGGARGTLRFDQLVAADNKEDAKRHGLLNDDELNSDDEGGEEGGAGKEKKVDEEEDETALLDQMLKERFLNTGEEDVFEENFTDDEESEDEADGADENKGEDVDDEEREQDRMAKHFAKRARRNRILEEYEGDSQFSRSRLIDEDVTMQMDLKTMKTSFSRKRTIEGSNLDSKENNCSSKKAKGGTSSKSSDVGADKPTSSFLSNAGSLSVALMASRTTAGRKRKTTFLSGKQQQTSSSFSRSHSSSSSSSKSVSRSFVFMTGDCNSQSAVSQLDASSNSFMGKTKGRGQANKARNAPKNVSRGSLWQKVQSKSFRAS